MFIVSVPDDVYHPFQVANQRLTEEGSDRDVRHFELEDPSSVCHLYYNPYLSYKFLCNAVLQE
jgi:hypothetical protein